MKTMTPTDPSLSQTGTPSAAKSRTRRSGSSTTARINPDPVDQSSRIETIRNRIPTWAIARAETERRRRRIVAAIMILLGVLLTWFLIDGRYTEPVSGWVADQLDAFLGSAAFLLPLLLIVGGVGIFMRRRNAYPKPTQIIGAFLFTATVAGLLQLSGSADENAGGFIGSTTIDILAHYLNELPAALMLLAIGALSVFLTAHKSPWGLYGEIRGTSDIPSTNPMPQTHPASAPRSSPRHVAVADSLVAESTATPKTPRKRTAETRATPKTAEPKPVSPPVINIPQTETVKPIQNTLYGAGAALPDTNLPLPDMAKLKRYQEIAPDEAALEVKARLIEETLASFKVDASVREINPGPTITQFTLEPGAGVKVRRITELLNDLALALAAPSVRIEAPVPGMARVGIEIPNEEVATVGLRETLESGSFMRSKAHLPIPLGRDVNGRYVVYDLAKMPHLLIAGATGAGKSVCINCIISTFLMTRTPDELRLVMIDPKMVELTGYNGVPHLQCPVITEMDKVVGALRLVVQEMQRRYDVFSKAGVRNLDGYRMKIEDEPNAEKIPYLVVIVDELADLMLMAPAEVEPLLQRIAQMGRASGIHLILATQRPSVDVITGVIKANVPTRIAFAVSSLTDSRVILDLPGAERLLGRGDMLFLPPDAAKPARIQGAFVDDKDLQYVVKHWHSVAPIPVYPKEWIDLPSVSANDDSGGMVGYEDDDPLMERALEVVRSQGTASASMLQRRLRIGYNRAARLIERMEDEGIIGPADGVRGRPILLDDD